MVGQMCTVSTSTLRQTEANEHLKVVQKLKQEFDESLKVLGRTFDWIIREGQPGEQICAAVEQEKANYLVIGDKRNNNVAKFLLGSLCNYCVENAKTNVIIVKEFTKL